MRLVKLTNPLDYSKTLTVNKVSFVINDFLNSLKPWKQEQWASKSREMKKYKKYLDKTLYKNQTIKNTAICAYCGFPLNIDGAAQKEHIVPKSLHEEFTFEKDNLVLSCSGCNSILTKGKKETIKTYNPIYSRCMFKIVHPYFDDPNDHYKRILQTNHKDRTSYLCWETLKGQETIEMMKINKPERINERYKKEYPILSNYKGPHCLACLYSLIPLISKFKSKY